jgi:hypothetical protein
MKPRTDFGGCTGMSCAQDGWLASIQMYRRCQKTIKTDLGTALFSAGIQHMLDFDFFSLCFDYDLYSFDSSTGVVDFKRL